MLQLLQNYQQFSLILIALLLSFGFSYYILPSVFICFIAKTNNKTINNNKLNNNNKQPQIVGNLTKNSKHTNKKYLFIHNFFNLTVGTNINLYTSYF